MHDRGGAGGYAIPVALFFSGQSENSEPDEYDPSPDDCDPAARE